MHVVIGFDSVIERTAHTRRASMASFKFHSIKRRVHFGVGLDNMVVVLDYCCMS